MARPLPPRPFLRGKCTHGIRETLAHVPGRTAAPYAAESSPDDCLATALDNRPAEPAGTLAQPQSRRLLLLGGAQLLELIDFCMHKIMRLHYQPRDEMEKMLFVLAKELVAQLGTLRGSRRPRRRSACPRLRAFCAPGIGADLYYLPRHAVDPRAARSTRDGCWKTSWGNCWWSRPGRLRGHCRWSAKCSVMIGGQLVSFRRLLGRSGPKSVSAGSSWRLQLTQNSAAPQTMAPVLQDKPCHSTDLAELVPTNILHYYLLFYCALCGKRPRTCRISLGGPERTP